jgi:hypothetical protein
MTETTTKPTPREALLATIEAIDVLWKYLGLSKDLSGLHSMEVLAPRQMFEVYTDVERIAYTLSSAQTRTLMELVERAKRLTLAAKALLYEYDELTEKK